MKKYKILISLFFITFVFIFLSFWIFYLGFSVMDLINNEIEKYEI